MMTRTSSKECVNAIEAAASAWLIRRDLGPWEERTQGHFDQWLEASPLHRVAYLRLELTWEAAARLQALGAGIPDELPPPPGQWTLTPFFEPRRPQPLPPAAGEAHVLERAPLKRDEGEAVRSRTGARRGRLGAPYLLGRGRAFAPAAALLLAVGMGAYALWVPGGERYATPIGGLESVPIVDGSRVTLNTDSQIRVAVSRTERRVDLSQGEAFFEVAKDPRRPFVVRIGTKRVIAVGTKFSVRRDEADEDQIQIVVTEGKVRLQDTDAPLRVRSEEAGGEDAGEAPVAQVLLGAGSIARAAEANVLVQRTSVSEAEEQLSWRRGVLRFRNQSLAQVAAEFNRYNVRKILIEDPALGQLKIEGNFRASAIDAFVRLLERGFPVRATSEEDRIVLSSRRSLSD